MKNAGSSPLFAGSYSRFLRTVFRFCLKGFTLLALLLSGSFCSILHATTYVWETSGSLQLSDGGGTWVAGSGTNWYNTATFTPGISGNTTSDTDIFGTGFGSAGTITVGAVNAGTIIFDPAGSGNYTLSSGTITLGSGVTVNTNATIGSTIAGIAGLLVNGGSILTLTGSNSYTGTTTITLSTLTLDTASGSLQSSSGIKLNDGTFNLDNTGGSAAYSGSFGALNFNSGDSTVSITETVAGQAQKVTFSSLSARAAGATGNFVNGNDIAGGGVGNSGTSGFVLSGVTANTFINYGDFYEGANYAWYDAGGFVRAINYASDPGAATSGATTSLASGTYQQITGSISDQLTGTFTTLNLTGSSNVTLDTPSSATLTVNGLLASGTTNSTINGGAGIRAASGAEMVIRTNSPSDFLTISTPILNNGGNALTKSGAGTLTLSASNSYTGATYLDGGTVLLSATGALGATSGISFNGGTLEYSSANLTDYSSLIKSSNGPISINTNAQNVTFASNLANTNAGGLTKLGLGELTLNGAQSYTGPTVVNSGTLQIVNGAAFGGNGGSYPLTINSGATVDLDGQQPVIGLLYGSGTIVNSNTNAILQVYPSGGIGLTSTFSGNVPGTLTGNGSIQLYVEYGTLVLTGTDQFGGGELDLGRGGDGGLIVTGSVGDYGVTYVGKFAGTNKVGFLTINGGYFSQTGNAMTIGSDGEGIVTITSGTLNSFTQPLKGGSLNNTPNYFNLNGGLVSTWMIHAYPVDPHKPYP